MLASGSGSLLQALLDAARDGGAPVAVVGVVSDRPDVGALRRAAAAGVDADVVAPADHADRGSWDAALGALVAAHEPDLVVSAGFARVLGPAFLDRFGGRTINTHPTLLPAFPGAHPVRDTMAYGVKITGATVHLVDAGVDTGPVLAQEAVEVRSDDTEESLHERIKIVERRMLVETVTALVDQGATVTGRGVRIP